MGKIVTSSDLEILRRLCPDGVLYDVDLAAISQWHIGGKADLILRPHSTEKVVQLRRWLAQRRLQHVVIGMTSNLLFADEGLRVPCIQITPSQMGKISIEHTSVNAQAGIWTPCLARKLLHAGLTGGEHICGIPGTLGGLICMNGGSQRKTIGKCIVDVESVDTEGKIHHRKASECCFDYRNSIFQCNNEIITSAILSFSPGDHATIREEMNRIFATRRQKFPLSEPNCGSVFKSDPAMYAKIGPPGAIIEKLGFKGKHLGGASISSRHANFIVNTGKASATEVLELIAIVRKAVYIETAYQMETEVHYVSPQGTITPADQVCGTDLM